MVRRSTAGRTSRKAKGNTIKIDFSGVETRKLAEEGEQLVTVVEVTQEEGEKGDYLKFKFQNEDGAVLYMNASLTEQSLWATKALLESLSIEVPEEEMDLDLEDMVDKEMMANVEYETYQGKKQARIVDHWPAEETKPKRGGAKADTKKAGKKAPAKPTEDEILDMSEEELEEVIQNHELDVDLADYKTLTKMRRAVADAAE